MNIFCLNFSKNIVYAEDSTSIEEELKDKTGEVLDDIDFSALEDSLNSLRADFDLFNGRSFKEFVYLVINGEETLSIGTLFDIVKQSFKSSIKNLLFPLLTILMIVLLCSLFNNIRSGRVSGVGEVIYLICSSIVIIITAVMASSVIREIKASLFKLQSQMNAIFPILITLMTLMGGVVSVKAYSPILAFLSNSISNIFIYILLPLFSFSLILSFVGNLSSNTKLGKLNGFITSLFKWVIGVTFAIFMSFLSIQGITAGSSDGISVKATKFAIKNYIPFLGGYISDGFELVKASGMIVKNAVGFAGIILLLASIIVPIFTLAVMELGFKLLAGVIEPMGDKKSSNLLYDIAKSFKLLTAIIVGTAIMYFLTIFLITCSLSNFI